MSPLEVQGLSLSHYAAVQAAVAEGFPDAEVLAVEGLPRRRWARVDPAWKLRLVDDRQAFAAYEDELAAAEDRLDRQVSPLSDDLASWASFLSAFAADGVEVLRTHELRLSDVGRLRRRWARRIGADAKLGEQLDELRKKPPPLPAIRVAKAVLRPSPFARGQAPEAGAASAPAASAEPELTLDRYAALCAEIAERPAETARALARHGLTGEAALAELDRLWRAALTESPALAADFRRLFAHNRARLSAPIQAPPEAPQEAPWAPAESPPMAPSFFQAAPPSIRAALRGTALVLDLPSLPTLPFAAAAPGPPAPAPPAPPAPTAAPPGTGTALAFEIPRGDLLPFAHAAPAKLAGTALAVSPRGPALPFVEGGAAPEIAARPAVADPRPPARLGTTAPLSPETVREASLPFALPPETPKPTKKNKLANLERSLKIPSQYLAHPPSVEAAPALTLEQHASLSVELRASPGREVETLARYGLTPESKLTVDRHYGGRMAREPGLRQTWDQACRTYQEWLQRSRLGSP